MKHSPQPYVFTYFIFLFRMETVRKSTEVVVGVVVVLRKSRVGIPIFVVEGGRLDNQQVRLTITRRNFLKLVNFLFTSFIPPLLCSVLCLPSPYCNRKRVPMRPQRRSRL